MTGKKQNTLLAGLNERQREAIRTTAGPVLVIAGPGSGKTRALTHRIAFLLASGIPPESILALTFTNKAAEEMRTRVRQLLSLQVDKATDAHRKNLPTYKLINLPPSELPFIGTFHSFAAFLLRREAGQIGYRREFTIYDEDDRMALVKEIMKELAVPKHISATAAAALISDLKAGLIAPDEYEGRNAAEPFGRAVAKIYETYQERLRFSNAMDFDDLIFHAVRLLQGQPAALRRWQARFSHIHVDEYQDTSLSQYEFVRLLAAEHKNIFAIGDDAQCLPPGISIDTPDGPRPIEQTQSGDRVLSGAGFGKITPSRVIRVHRRQGREPLIRITTASGRQLMLTAGHIVFAKLTVDHDLFYVYLMERRDKGFRIGHTRGVRGGTRNGARVLVNGLQIRANQEAADKIWILKAVRTKEEAVLHEQLYAFKYGIPTTVFYDKGRNISLSQPSIDFLYSAVDSRAHAERIFSDLRLSKDHPHHRPRGVTRTLPHAPTRHRTILDVCFFGGSQPSARYPWHDHRIALISASSDLRRKLNSGQWSVRSAKPASTSWRIETARKHYLECREFVQTLAAAGSLEVHEKARLARNRGNFDLMPASHLRPGMVVPILSNSGIREERIGTIEEVPYEGPLFDISVENTHNYSANGFIVHNSIYSWRQADYRNILNFERDWPEAKVILLEENYRSTPEILSAANTLIAKNQEQKPKSLWTKNPSGRRPEVRAHEHERAEAAFIAGEIFALHQRGQAWRECAVLYRTNAQSRAIEEALIEYATPYTIIGGIRFFSRREIKDLISYLRYLTNPDDALALKRIINVPARGIGPKTFLKYLSKETKNLPIKDQQRIAAFEALIARLTEAMAEKTLAQFLRLLIKSVGYEEYLADSRDGESRIENIRELVSVARKYDALAPREAIVRLLEEVALLAADDAAEAGDERVRLMTLHAAKGLEFSVVFMTGLEEGLLPHAKAITGSRAELEEERRLAYVGMTRAKERLYLTWAITRTLFGEREVNMPSRFLKELPEELLAGHSYLPGESEMYLVDEA